MSEWSRQIEFYVDIAQVGGNYCLLEAKTESAAPIPALMQGDILPIHIYFRQRQSSVGVATLPITLPAGATIVIAGKESGELLTGALLFASGSFVAAGAGDDAHYEATLDLSAAAVETALGSAEWIEIKVDIEVQPSGTTEPSTFRFNAILHRHAYAGEAAPAGGLYVGTLIRIETRAGVDYMVFYHPDGTEFAAWPKP